MLKIKSVPRFFDSNIPPLHFTRSALSLYCSLAILLIFYVPASLAQNTPYAATTENGYGAVATVNPIATKAALNAYKKGGNAVDAAIAAALTLGVVDTHNSGIGGGCFVLIRWANGHIEAVDGREMAPAAAHRDMYLRNGIVQPKLSRTGPLASGIPGSLAAYDYLAKKGGTLPLSDALIWAADIAEQGFEIDKMFAQRLSWVAKDLADYPAGAQLLLDSSGKPVKSGHLLIQKDLAKTYRTIAKQGVSHFYGGEFAKTVARWMKDNGGILSVADFSNYQLKHRKPVQIDYRGYTLIGFPPPSSGGVHVFQILNMLEQFDLEKMGAADRYHLIAEAMKLAFADRAWWLGDPDYAQVPRGILDKSYAAMLAKKIDMDSAATVGQHSTPPDSDSRVFGKHTTHIATADKAGNWVAITTTLNTSFGSKVMVPGTGVFLNNQMDDFSIQPGVPNAFGLVGVEANSIQPGKRPLSSMSPTIVLDRGKPILTLGAAGGPTIISQVAQTLVNILDLGAGTEQALSAPRIHHQWRPRSLYIEESLASQVKDSLVSRGHTLKSKRRFGSTQIIRLTEDGRLVAVTEPRVITQNR